MIIDIGCGRRKFAGALGVDINPLSNADVLVDLNSFPYPFKDNVFEKVICHSILEHLDDLVKVLQEIHRISKDGAELIVTGPHFSSSDFYADPTHRRAFSSQTFDVFVNSDDPHFPKLQLKDFTIGVFGSKGLFRNLIKKFINKWIRLYERRYAFIFPSKGISFIFRIVK